MITIDPQISEASAATMLGISKDTLAKWRRDGVGPKFSHVPILSKRNHGIRYRISDLKTFAEQGRLPISNKRGRPRKDHSEDEEEYSMDSRFHIRGPEKRGCRLSIAITPTSFRELAAAADDLGLTVSEYVRRAVGAE